MRYVRMTAACALAWVCVAHSTPLHAQTTQQSLQALKQEARKLGTPLVSLQKSVDAQRSGVARDFPRPVPKMVRMRNGYVTISAYGPDPAALRTQLVAKGMLDAKVHARSVSGRVPVASLGDIASIDGLAFVKSSGAMAHAGLVTSQGDRSLRSDLARQQLGVTGKGIRVGVLSDSFDCASGPFAPGQRFTRAADDVQSNDLPADIHVLSDLDPASDPDCIDEGRAMMQLIHDVAPGSPMSFHTAFISEEDFAQGILDLAADGSKVIVDDIKYYAEPMFENGVIADAVNAVKKQGVAYFSSAGNEARQAHESKFRLSEEPGVFGIRHDFNPKQSTVDTLQSITIPPGGDTGIILNWDEPFLTANGVRGSASDVDLIFAHPDGTPVEDCFFAGPETTVCQFPGLDFNVGVDAVELAEVINLSGEPVEVAVTIELFEGPAPNLLKYVWIDFGEPMTVNEFDTKSGSTYGHANAEGAEAVGAAWWFDTGAFRAANHPQCKDACVNQYSSAGGTPILFDDLGERKRIPFIGFKPGITGPDGTNTTFFFLNQQSPAPGEPDDFPNFFGTSAAAPHVAAVAALMLDKRARDIAARKRFIGPRELTPDLIFGVLRLTADDIKKRSFVITDPSATEPLPFGTGFDFDSGFGFVNAKKALQAISGF